MAALLRIAVLEEWRAVEVGQAVTVARKMGRHPVKNDAETSPVTGIDQEAQVIGAAIAAGWREIPDRLVAPRLIERVFGEGHEFDMGEALFNDVRDQEFGGLPVGQRAAVRIAAPRPKVHLVDRQRRVQPVAGTPPGKPGFVLPQEWFGRAKPRCGGGPELVLPGERIDLQSQCAGMPVANLKLVEDCSQPGNEQFPDAGATPDPHGVTAPVPAIEIPNHADASGVGGPDGKEYPGDAVDSPGVRPQEMVGGVVVAPAEGADLAFVKLGPEAVRIEALADLAVAPPDPQLVALWNGRRAALPFKEIGLPDAEHAGSSFHDVHADRVRKQRPNDDRTVRKRVSPQPAERVVMARSQQGIEVRRQQRRHGSPMTDGVTFAHSVTDQARTLR